MGDRSEIEWTEATWNPTTGCSRVSEGCDNCYAIRVSARLQHAPAYQGTVEESDWTGRVNTVPDRLDQPVRWRRPRRVLVNSMSDLFHPEVPLAFVRQVFEVMAVAKQHTFQILTKRPHRLEAVLRTLSDCHHGHHRSDACRWCEPLPNVWLGTSIESDRYAFRADHLRLAPAAVRFVSLEPLLGPLPSLLLDGIDWVIVGGERTSRSGDEPGVGTGRSGPLPRRWSPLLLQTVGRKNGEIRRTDARWLAVGPVPRSRHVAHRRLDHVLGSAYARGTREPPVRSRAR